MTPKHCGKCGGTNLYLDHVESLADEAEVICDDCGEVQTKYIKAAESNKARQALEEIHQKMMEIEQIFEDSWLYDEMPDISDLRSDAQVLCGEVQEAIDNMGE